ncbi:hypothetical protein R3P38DRAFT_2810458 [Favolaschia claudopus]|uniref:Uncharacterized protein n=1 Tax=Favolaschia claudopus TaxID=2862362 RepID=A0AAV9ZB09_9AGAR
MTDDQRARSAIDKTNRSTLVAIIEAECAWRASARAEVAKEQISSENLYIRVSNCTTDEYRKTELTIPVRRLRTEVACRSNVLMPKTLPQASASSSTSTLSAPTSFSISHSFKHIRCVSPQSSSSHPAQPIPIPASPLDKDDLSSALLLGMRLIFAFLQHPIPATSQAARHARFARTPPPAGAFSSLRPSTSIRTRLPTTLVPPQAHAMNTTSASVFLSPRYGHARWRTAVPRDTAEVSVAAGPAGNGGLGILQQAGKMARRRRGGGVSPRTIRIEAKGSIVHRNGCRWRKAKYDGGCVDDDRGGRGSIIVSEDISRPSESGEDEDDGVTMATRDPQTRLARPSVTGGMRACLRDTEGGMARTVCAGRDTGGRRCRASEPLTDTVESRKPSNPAKRPGVVASGDSRRRIHDVDDRGGRWCFLSLRANGGFLLHDWCQVFTSSEPGRERKCPIWTDEKRDSRPSSRQGTSAQPLKAHALSYELGTSRLKTPGQFIESIKFEFQTQERHVCRRYKKTGAQKRCQFCWAGMRWPSSTSSTGKRTK